jgi:hypothetical protein
MRKLAMVALVSLLLPAALEAQGGGRGRGGAPQNIAKIVLDARAEFQPAITDEQAAKITALAAKVDTLNAPIIAERTKLGEAIQAAGGRANMTDEMRAKNTDLMTQSTKVRDDAVTQLKTILTADQHAKLQEIVDRSGRGGRRGGGGGLR